MFIILLIFGAKKLPELAQGLGRGIREFKKASNEIQDDFKASTEPEYALPKKEDASIKETI